MNLTTTASSLWLISALAMAILVIYFRLRQTKKSNNNKQLIDQLTKQLDEQTNLNRFKQQDYSNSLQLFANVHQDLHAPITLILTPINDLLLSATSSFPHMNQELKVVQKNAYVVLRRINQLLDLQKLDLDQFVIRPSKCDVLAIIKNVMKSYSELAVEQQISLELFSTEQEVFLQTDIELIGKVFHNLLYQVFKTTQHGGTVKLKVHYGPAMSDVLITVEDNGKGLTQEEKTLVDSFGHQPQWANISDYSTILTFLLVKKLVTQLGGTITMTTAQWKGTTVCVALPLESYSNEETSSAKHLPIDVTDVESTYTVDIQSLTNYVPQVADTVSIKNSSILLIEKDQELLAYLTEKLRPGYDILSASTGIIGIQLAIGNIPDLVICASQLPDRKGSEIVTVIKSDFKTSHIPVILLTSEGTTHQSVTKADSYISEPFNLVVLKETIKNLLKKRVSLKELFTTDFDSNLEKPDLNQFDKKFITDFSAIVENNIANEFFTVEDVCRGIGVSKIQLYRKVKVLFDMSVNEYIINTRLQRAKYLLKNESIPIAEIAVKVGFSSAAYFSTVFKSKFQLTPKQYKSEYER